MLSARTHTAIPVDVTNAQDTCNNQTHQLPQQAEGTLAHIVLRIGGQRHQGRHRRPRRRQASPAAGSSTHDPIVHIAPQGVNRPK